MRAIVFREDRKVALEHLPDPEPGPDELSSRSRPAASAILILKSCAATMAVRPFHWCRGTSSQAKSWPSAQM